jgi:hypothetical protein
MLEMKSDLQASSPNLYVVVKNASKYPRFRKAVLSDPEAVAKQYNLDSDDTKKLINFTKQFEGAQYPTTEISKFVKVLGKELRPSRPYRPPRP